MRRIVITGLGALSPLGLTVDETWKSAIAGKSGITKVTKFDVSNYSVQIAGEVKGFDPLDHFPKKELKKMDTFIQYAIVTAREAMKDAGLKVTDELAPKVGVNIGSGIGGLPAIEEYANVLKEKGPRFISPFFIPMSISNMAAGLISIEFGLKNYNASSVAACSSSAYAIGDAFKRIQQGEADVMLTGGTEAAICGLGIGGFAAMKALSMRNDDPAKASRPFDVDRDGFVLSEGSAVLVLEELSLAKARGAKIYAEIVGYGSSSDAFHITTPNTDGPSLALANALASANLQPKDVDYINAHGTSTPLGDKNEIASIKKAFQEDAKNVSISSTKSMTGHLLGATGALETLFVIKAIQDGIIPPTINVENQDPACDLDVTPNVAVKKDVNVGVSNSFGFGGTNVSLVVKKYTA